MKKQLLFLLFIFLGTSLFAKTKGNFGFSKFPFKRMAMVLDTPPPPNDLSGFGNYNFGGGNTGFNTAQAQVDYGFKYSIGFVKNSYFEFRPTISTPVNAALKQNYIPALMLPGTASINLNTFFPISKYVVWSPINVGLKFLSGFTDSAKTIIQHNIRTALSFQIDQLISLQGQYTWAWHNSTDDSERNFNFAFNKNNSAIQYWLITLQGRVSADDAKTPSFIIIQWRNLVNSGQFPGLQNYRIFTIGFKASFNLSTGVQTVM